VAIAVVGGTVAISIGVSRVVLGVHYPSDVIAGWLLAAAIVASALLVAELLFSASGDGRSARTGP
jgi:undecaprenyl-diphosphatase